jgi:AhpD family alkylhydroperoxidase
MGVVKNVLKKRTENRARLEKEAPDFYNGFNEWMKHFYKHGVLERKYNELMAVSASVATRCVPCLANHANNAMTAGATTEEVLEAADPKG